ncbi:hypothetical protein K469DRAFT_685985 [Zopfia rhizophila CBS 207.26]|uniref:Uncharacterized protein n=1 Tax=Zopfia rhizophila CBS 207.26 TaxID=1314779 RepID=A0A6A6E9Q9_9PEZI|nr:hypothetical protein K469DRAFT_685985 [Zopfia rhizophila CBS 207.26]
MAPPRGSGGGGGDSSSSSTCSCGSDYPCTTQMQYIYGDRYISFYSNGELYAQLMLFIIWSITLILLFLLSQTRKTKARWLQLTMGLFLISFILLCARYGLLVSESDVPLGIDLNHLSSFCCINLEWPSYLPQFISCCSIGGVRNTEHGVFDLGFHYILASPEWIQRYFSDRDFGLTYTARQIRELKTSSDGVSGLSPYYIESRAFDPAADGYLHDRGIQIKISVTADFLAVALAVFIAVMAGMMWARRSNPVKDTVWLLVAATGFLLSTMFRVVVATHFVLWNWKVVTDILRWFTWIDTYPTLGPTQRITALDGFLVGYRMTVDGFPVVQAVLEPLGIVLACVATLRVMWIRRSDMDRAMQNEAAKA